MKQAYLKTSFTRTPRSQRPKAPSHSKNRTGGYQPIDELFIAFEQGGTTRTLVNIPL